MRRTAPSRAALRARFLLTCAAIAGVIVAMPATSADEAAGRVIVQMQTNPAGDPTVFAFIGTALEGRGSGQTERFVLSHGQQLETSLPAGTYAIAETPIPGWTLTSALCSDGSLPSAIRLDADEVVTCVFSSTRSSEPAPPPAPPP
nr:hypothetical protein [Actinomycetota bacterium]